MPYINGVYYTEREIQAARALKKQQAEHDDSGSVLTSAVVGAVTGSSVVGAIVGGSLLGGLLGDAIEGTGDSWL